MHCHFVFYTIVTLQIFLEFHQVFFAERFFTLFDKNGDGKIDMKELVEGLELLKNGTVADKLTFLFRVYDLDGEINNINL